MLRRVGGVMLEHRPHWLTGRGDLWLVSGRQRFLVRPRARSRDVRRWARVQEAHPVSYPVQDADRTFWQFRHRWYVEHDGLSPAAVEALLITRERRQSAAVARAQAQASANENARPGSRGRVPDEIRQFVWERDAGRCVSCGACSELQFDHVIPLALGGSCDPENLQILCGPCNRKKGVGVAVG